MNERKYITRGLGLVLGLMVMGASNQATPSFPVRGLKG